MYKTKAQRIKGTEKQSKTGSNYWVVNPGKRGTALTRIYGAFPNVQATVLQHGTTGIHEEGHSLDALKCQKTEFKTTGTVAI